MSIHNGQDGPAVPEEKEENIGAFTVANLNDTDGDGNVDNEDNIVKAAISEGTVKGRDEVDLMRLVLRKPVPDLGGKVTLKVVSGEVKFWRQSTKQAEVRNREFPTEELPLVLWVEATAPSSEVRDIVIEMEYKGVTDTVKATGVWAQTTRSLHDNGDDYLIWKDLTDPPKTTLNSYLGDFGLSPIHWLGVYNIIAMQFTVSPPGIGKEPGVYFDLTRRVQARGWTVKTDVITPIIADDWPVLVEDANDDWKGMKSPEIDESEAPTDQDHMYAMDAPGYTGDQRRGNDELVLRMNFEQFVRVRFNEPISEVIFDSGQPNLQGSRCSPIFEWHARHRLVPDGKKWKRSTGDDQETDENDVGNDRIVVGERP